MHQKNRPSITKSANKPSTKKSNVPAPWHNRPEDLTGFVNLLGLSYNITNCNFFVSVKRKTIFSFL